MGNTTWPSASPPIGEAGAAGASITPSDEVYHIITDRGRSSPADIANGAQVPTDNVIHTILVGRAPGGRSGRQSRHVVRRRVIVRRRAHWFSKVDSI